eukprot:6026847-Pyramimonas_sp.AAC.1
MAATAIDWPAYADEYLYDEEHGQGAHYFLGQYTEEGLEWAKEKLQQVRQCIKTAGRRRAAPEWSVPLELFWVICSPYRRTAKRCRG